LTSPFAQRGDFPFSGFYGAITDYYPDPASSSAYKSGVVRYISANPTGTNTDLFNSIGPALPSQGHGVYLPATTIRHRGRGGPGGRDGRIAPGAQHAILPWVRTTSARRKTRDTILISDLNPTWA